MFHEDNSGSSGSEVHVPGKNPGKRKLLLSVNRGIVNKQVSDPRLFVDGFENVEITLDELVSVVREGWAYCSQLNGDRRTANFLASNIVSVDIDHGMTIAEALAHPLVSVHAALLYPTPNHTEASPRFRIIFITPRTVTDPREMKTLLRGLALRLNGDRAATDATRLFFGHRGAEVRVLGGTLGDAQVKELTEQVKALEAAKTTKASARSPLALANDLVVRLADGGSLPLRDISGKPAVFCPYHVDEHASAFVVHSQHGTLGIHCMTCSQTFWPGNGPSYVNGGAKSGQWAE